MILNKFSRISTYHSLRSICLHVIALSLFSCTKTANSNANKTYIAVTHIAYGVGPLNITLGGDSLLPVPISFGTFSGTQGYPYDTATAGIQDLIIYQGSDSLLSGNAAFQQATHYSLFIYDTLDRASLGLITLQDNPGGGTDTSTFIRYLNFVPGSSIGIKLIYIQDTSVKDTVTISPSLFVGYNPNPGAYLISHKVHLGGNQVFAFVDSARPAIDSSNFIRLDSLHFDLNKFYNIYLQVVFDSASLKNKIQIRSIQLN
jgi:hypothetical protein